MRGTMRHVGTFDTNRTGREEGEEAIIIMAKWLLLGVGGARRGGSGRGWMKTVR
jgi:hypothetical protein